MKILCVFGRHAYGDPARGEGYEHASFLPALAALGHELELFDSLDRASYGGFAALNRAFVERVERCRPQAILCVLMHYEIWTETLDLVRSRSPAALLNWGTDDSWKFEQFGRFVAPHVDLYVTTSPAAAARARRLALDNVVPSQWAASKLCAPLPASRCRYQASFVGTAYGNRRRWVEALRARGIEIECFGHGWPAGPVDTPELLRIANESLVSLNFGDSGLHFRRGVPYRSRQIKARTFEVPGAGGLLLTQPADDLERYFAAGKEIDVFASPDEAAAKIRRHVNEPERRDAMARAGHERVRREHTYAARFAPLLEEAMSRARARPPATAPVRGFEAIAAQHSAPWWLRVLRVALAAPASLLFGARRGPRAARRLLFELSWRLAGESTYSARGWPGRTFYRES